MPKQQLKILVGYCIFMLILTQYIQHSHRYQGLFEPIAAFLGAFLPIAMSVFALKNGWALGRTRQVDRDESPVGFWFLVALGFAIGAYLIFQGIKSLVSLL